MALLKLSFVLCILAICAVDNVSCGSKTLAPSPAVDCTSLVTNMVDCLTYVTNGSTTSKPEGTCCSGLKTVLKADAKCLCEGLKSSAQFGVVLNITKAETLPSACHIKAPSVTNCGLSTAAPVAAPAQSPSAAAGPAGSTMGTTDQAPDPSPKSDSAAISISVSFLVAALLVAYFSSF